MVNYIKVLDGVYFYCIDCAEMYDLDGEIQDIRKVGDVKFEGMVQCFACSKHTQIYIQDPRVFRKWEETITAYVSNDYQPDGDGTAEWWNTVVSTRPACPICKQGTLTGQLTNTGKPTSIEFITSCQNPECISVAIYLDKNWNVKRANTRDGGIFMYTGG